MSTSAEPATEVNDPSPVGAEPGRAHDAVAGPLDGIVLPGLLIGVPAILVIGALLAQIAVGAAWLPVIRRWLHRRVV